MPLIPFNKFKEQVEAALQPLRELIDRQKSASLMIVAGVIILLDVVLILMPLVQSAYKNFAKLSVLTKDVGEIRRDKGIEERLKTSLKKSKQDLEKLEQLLALGDISLYLETLSAMAAETNVNLIAVRPVSVISPEGHNRSAPRVRSDNAYEAAYFSIAATAGYHELGKFVERMENSTTFIKVVSLMITATEENPIAHDARIMIKMAQKSETE